MCEWEVEREREMEKEHSWALWGELKTPTTPVAYINQYSDRNLHKSAHYVCGIFPLDSFIRSFSYNMHSWYLLFSWHSEPLRIQYKRFCQLPQQTATHKFCLGRYPVSYCSISKEEWRNQWSSLHWITTCTSINQLCCMSHSFCSTLAFSFWNGI